MPEEQSAKFLFDFIPEGKSAQVIEEEDGSLTIEGYGADFDVDRQDEAFEPGAFERGLKNYLETNPVLCYHHQFDKALGRVVSAEVDGSGVHIKAQVDKPAAGSWAEDVYNKIKSGTIKAFSVGGIFRRKLTENGPRIHDVDIAEWSVTPVPINPRTTFNVVAGKAFESEETLDPEVDFSAIDGALDAFNEALNKYDK